MDAKRLACAHSSLIVAKHFTPIIEALYNPESVEIMESLHFKSNSFKEVSELAQYTFIELENMNLEPIEPIDCEDSFCIPFIVDE